MAKDFKIHVPVEQYGYVEASCDSPVTSKMAYDEIKNAFKVDSEGLDQKEWNWALDKYLETNTGDVDIYMRMSTSQKDIFQEIKRSLKRIEYKNNK